MKFYATNFVLFMPNYQFYFNFIPNYYQFYANDIYFHKTVYLHKIKNSIWTQLMFGQ